MRAQFLSFLILLAATAEPTAAAESPICADRPGKSTGTCTVPTGHLQVEIGLADWTLQTAGNQRDTGLTIGESSLRFGLTDRSDLGIGVGGWQRLTSRSPATSDRAAGFGDVIVLYKHRLTATDAPVAVALNPVLKMPTAKRLIGNRRWEAGLLLPIDFNIGSSPFSVNLTPELDWTANSVDRGHHPTMVQVVSLGWQASERLNLSAELWGQWDWDPSGLTRQASIDAAIAYLAAGNVQLDGGINFGLNRATPSVELYTGLSLRF